MHHQGDLLGLGSVWGYVEGGMGRVSFAIAEAALEAGAVIAAGVPVAAIEPGEGVALESGEPIRAPVVVCNADPKRTLAMLEAGTRGPGRLSRAARGVGRALAGGEAQRRAEPAADLHRGAGRDRAAPGDGRRSPPGSTRPRRRSRRRAPGEPAIGFAELYFQTRLRRSVAPRRAAT